MTTPTQDPQGQADVHRRRRPLAAVAAVTIVLGLLVALALALPSPVRPAVSSGPSKLTMPAADPPTGDRHQAPPDDALGPFELIGDPSPSAAQSRVNQVDAARQEHLSECMTAAGQTYEPLDLAAVGGAAPTPASLGLDEDTFLRRHGYGYTASFDRSLTGPASSDEPLAGGFPAIPEAEQNEYFSAFDECWESAVARYPDPNLVDPADARAVTELLDDDPEITAARRRWVSCMRDHGFDYASRDEVFADLEERMEPVHRAQARTGGPPSDQERLQPRVETLLSEVRAHEMAVAKADADCKQPLDAAIDSLERETEDAWDASGGDLETFARMADE